MAAKAQSGQFSSAEFQRQSTSPAIRRMVFGGNNVTVG
jgi:hypothetical protein